MYHWNAVDHHGDNYEGDTTTTLAEAVAAAAAELFITADVAHVDVYRGSDSYSYSQLLYRITRNDHFVPFTGTNGPAVYVEDMNPAPASVTGVDLTDDGPF